MSRFFKPCLLLCAALTASSVSAQGLQSMFVQDVGPNLDGSIMYTQMWSAVHLTETFGDVHEVYVKGEGKLGSFHGVLELHCAAPELSNWLALGGFLREHHVPTEAIREMRRQYC